jgi:hypothetical protein
MLSFREAELSSNNTTSCPPSPLCSASPSKPSLSLDSTPDTPTLTTVTTASTPSSSQLPVKQSSCRTAGAAQYRGVQRIRFGLSEQLLALEARAKPKDDHLVPDTPSNTIPATLTAAERDAADRGIVEDELRRYEALVIPSHIAVNDGVDLLQFWDVRLLRQMRRLHGLTIYPALGLSFGVFSSIPCCYGCSGCASLCGFVRAPLLVCCSHGHSGPQPNGGCSSPSPADTQVHIQVPTS